MSILGLFKNLFFGKSASAKSKRHAKVVIAVATRNLKSGDTFSKKAVVKELDSSLEILLSDLYGKNSLGENLKKISNKFPSSDYQKIWDAHKIRNRLVHEPQGSFSDKELDFAIITLRKALYKFI